MLTPFCKRYVVKRDAPKVGCNESLHPAICVKLPVAGLRKQTVNCVRWHFAISQQNRLRGR